MATRNNSPIQTTGSCRSSGSLALEGEPLSRIGRSCDASAASSAHQVSTFRSSIIVRFFAAFASLSLFASIAVAQSSLPSQNPLAFGRPGIRALAPFETPETGIGLGWTNTFNRLGRNLTLDGEFRTLELQSRVPLSALLGQETTTPDVRDWSLHLALSAHSIDGGSLDNFIEEWDRAIGWPNHERERSPTDRYRLQGISREGKRFSIPPDSFTLGGLQLEAEYQLYDLNSETISVYGGMRFPLERNAFSGESPDPLVGLRSATTLGPLKLFGGAQLGIFLDRTSHGIEYAPAQFGAYAQGEVALFESFAAIIGVSGNSPLITGIKQYPDFELYVDVGAKIDFECSQLTFIIREDPYKSEDTTDVSILVGYSIAL